jgi:hypothetical protein
MSVVIVRYLMPMTYRQTVGVFTSRDIALESIRLTMAKLGDHRQIHIVVSPEQDKPYTFYAYEKGAKSNIAIAVIEDYTMFPVRDSAQAMVDN